MRDLSSLSSSMNCHLCQNVGLRLLLLAPSSSSFFDCIRSQQRRFLRHSPFPERARDYYQVLGVNRTATQQEIKDAYISQSKKLHPDRIANYQASSGKIVGHEKFQELQEAYDVLRKPSSRMEYDQRGFVPPHQPMNPQRHGDFYRDRSQRQNEYEQWKFHQDPWEYMRQGRSQRFSEYYQKYATQHEPFRRRGGYNTSSFLELMRIFLVFTSIVFIGSFISSASIRRREQKRIDNLVEKDEIARSYLRQAHVQRAMRNGGVFPTEADLAHILKQDIDDMAKLREAEDRPNAITDERRWMTAVQRDHRR